MSKRKTRILLKAMAGRWGVLEETVVHIMLLLGLGLLSKDTRERSMKGIQGEKCILQVICKSMILFPFHSCN
jgi:hypothetical protein